MLDISASLVLYYINRREVKTVSTKKPRYSIIIDDEMLEEIDDFRYDNRFSSRAKATERLIMLGLEAYSQMSDEEKKAEREQVKQSKG